MQRKSAILVLCVCLVGCDDKNNRYLDNSTTEITVEIEGLPHADNQISILEKETQDWSGDLTGWWEGVFEYYVGSQPAPYPIHFRVEEGESGWTITSYGSRSEHERFLNVSVLGARLEFDYEGHTYTENGEPIRYHAVLFASDHRLVGVYRLVIAERGGVQIFADYDVNLNRMRNNP